MFAIANDFIKISKYFENADEDDVSKYFENADEDDGLWLEMKMKAEIKKRCGVRVAVHSKDVAG